MTPKKNTILLFTAFMILICMSIGTQAGNTGPVHALEGMIGAKYSGAPSQMLAGKMGMAFDELTSVKNQMFEGTISNPAPLKKLGYKSFTQGDQIQMTRTGDHTWRIKHVKTNKVFTLKVVS